MSRKKRSNEEVIEILKAHAEGKSVREICAKYVVSESALNRLLRVARGEPADASARKQQKKIEKLEKLLAEREREIALMKDILKKS